MIRFIFTFLGLVFMFTVLSQTKPEQQKKYFQRENGQIFWQVDLPVYIQISGNQDMSNSLKMKEVENPNMEKHSNPFYWDGPGVHFIRHLDKQGETGDHYVAFKVHVDGIAPVTKLKFSPAPYYFANNTKYYGKNLSASLSFKDEMSGVAKTYTSLNGSNYTEYSGEIKLEKEGENSLKYYSVDSTGNEEKEHEIKFTVDLTAPVSSHKFERDFVDNVLSPRTIIKLSATDNIAGVAATYYRIDQNTKLKYGSYIGLSNLSDGPHQIIYYSKDKVKNEESSKKIDFYLDKTPPVISSQISGDFYEKNGRTYLASDATISLTATDNKAGVKSIEYSINGSKSQVYDKPFVLPNKNGFYAIKFRGTDNVNNKGIFTSDENSKKLNNLYRDNTAPKISFGYIGKKFYTRDTMFITKSTKIKLSSIDNESGTAEILYSLNGQSDQKYNEPFTVDKEGFNTLKYKGIDNVKNERSDDFFFIVDNTGPEPFYHMSLEKIGTQKLVDKNEEIPIYAANTRLYLAATDKLVGTKAIYYKLNGKEYLYSTPIKLSKAGMYSLIITAIDELGNKTVSEEHNFVIQ